MISRYRMALMQVVDLCCILLALAVSGMVTIAPDLSVFDDYTGASLFTIFFSLLFFYILDAYSVGMEDFKDTLGRILVACVLVTHCLFRPLCTFLGKRTAGVFHYSVRAECKRNVSESIQKLITDTLAFDKNVKLNSLFYKSDEERVTVCCNMETLGEHKALLDRLVSRLRSRSEVYSAGWEKKEAPQEDF